METGLKATANSRKCDHRTQTVVTHAGWVAAPGVPQDGRGIHQVLHRIRAVAPDRGGHSSIGESVRMRDSGADEVEVPKDRSNQEAAGLGST
eukprot:530376-Pleurochrysis_carterae.AAC.1